MTESIIECRLEWFFFPTACISFSDEKRKFRVSIRCGKRSYLERLLLRGTNVENHTLLFTCISI